MFEFPMFVFPTFEFDVRESDLEFLHFCYLCSDGHKDRDPKLHAVRDTAALMWLAGPLIRRGYTYGGPIFNHAAGPKDPHRPPIDRRRLRAGKVLVLPTRPPYSDREVGGRKPIERSFSRLEKIIFRRVVRDYFVTLARSEILMTDGAAALSPEVKKRQAILLRTHGGSGVESYGTVEYTSTGERTLTWEEPDAPSTVAFLLYREELWRGGPAAIVAWAQDGTTTMVWCKQLATKFRHLLFKSPFVMAELKPGPPMPRAESLDFADTWETRILAVAEPSISPHTQPDTPRRTVVAEY